MAVEALVAAMAVGLLCAFVWHRSAENPTHSIHSIP